MAEETGEQSPSEQSPGEQSPSQDRPGEESPRPATNDSGILPVMLAVALAVAAQLALQDGLTLLGLAGYGVAAWLFVASVRAIFDLPAPSQAETSPALTDVKPTRVTGGASRMRYLRRHWRQVTIAEVFRGDIPPSRLGVADDDLTSETASEDRPAAEPTPTPAEETSPRLAVQMKSWTAGDSAASSPTAVKVTPQGDVLVLDSGLEQVQRYDEAGNLLATYALAGLASVDVLDLDVSPDGRTLYIVDAASRRLQVITLEDHDH